VIAIILTGFAVSLLLLTGMNGLFPPFPPLLSFRYVMVRRGPAFFFRSHALRVVDVFSFFLPCRSLKLLHLYLLLFFQFFHRGYRRRLGRNSSPSFPLPNPGLFRLRKSYYPARERNFFFSLMIGHFFLRQICKDAPLPLDGPIVTSYFFYSLISTGQEAKVSFLFFFFTSDPLVFPKARSLSPEVTSEKMFLFFFRWHNYHQ